MRRRLCKLHRLPESQGAQALPRATYVIIARRLDVVSLIATLVVATRLFEVELPK